MWTVNRPMRQSAPGPSRPRALRVLSTGLYPGLWEDARAPVIRVGLLPPQRPPAAACRFDGSIPGPVVAARPFPAGSGPVAGPLPAADLSCAEIAITQP